MESDNRLKLLRVAKECLGKDMAPFNDEFGCAEALNQVFKKAFGRDIGGGASTYYLYQVLLNDKRFEKVPLGLPGDILCSATGYGNKKKLRNGHVGIVSEAGFIMSNTSANGLWENNYTLETWKRRYKDFGQYPMDYFRVVTPAAPAPEPIPQPVVNPMQPTPKPMQTLIPEWLRLFMERSKAVIGYADPVFGGVLRSPKWSKLRNEFLKEFPDCEACGVEAEIAHHIVPYSKNPLLELDRSNLITLCDECHLVLAHLKSFKRFDPDIKEVARLFRKKVENATIKG